VEPGKGRVRHLLGGASTAKMLVRL